MAASLRIVLGLAILASAFSFKIQHPLQPSGWLLGSPYELPAGHIHGGTDAVPAEFPHQTVVYSTTASGQTFICGGSVISAEYVMTAGHCPDGSVSFEIIMGAHDRNDDSEPSRSVRFPTLDQVTIHADYDGSLIINDIAVLQMDPPLEFTDAIQAISLSATEPPTGTLVTLTGWGRTGDGAGDGLAGILQKAEVQIAADSVCEDFYSGDQNMIQVICLHPELTGGTSSCGGDSGGPLNYDGDAGRRIAGITSWGSSAGCSQGFPIGYVSVPFFLDWIELNTGITP